MEDGNKHSHYAVSRLSAQMAPRFDAVNNSEVDILDREIRAQ